MKVYIKSKQMIPEEMRADLELRWNRLRNYMRENEMDACLLANGVNIYYTTGKMYNGYFYLPVEGEPCFFVKRPGGYAGDRVRYIRKPEEIVGHLEALGMSKPARLMLEADEWTYNEYLRLRAVFAPEREGNATTMMRMARRVKTPWEIGQLRLSASRHAAVYAEIKDCYRPGMTDLEFQFEIESRMRRHGSIGLFRAFGANMDIFMGSILTGANAEAPSPFDFALGGGGMNDACPLGANGTPLREGMAVMVDMAGNYTAYITDMTRVFAVGQLPHEAYRAHQVALEIQSAIEGMAKPGVACADLYMKALEIVKAAGLEEYFMGTKLQAKFVGHGIGLQINELPVLTPRSKEVLLENMVFALEPKFVIPGVGAVGVENSFLVKAAGLEKLTLFPEEIIQLQ